MKAERQHKEATSRVIEPAKGGGGHIVDNRSQSIDQREMVSFIQKKEINAPVLPQYIGRNNKGAFPIQRLSIKKATDKDLPETEGDVLYCIGLLGIDKTKNEFQSLGIYLVDNISDSVYYDQVFDAINAISATKIPYRPSTRPNPQLYFNAYVIDHSDYPKIALGSGLSNVSEDTEAIWSSIVKDKGGALYDPSKKNIVIQSDKYSKRDLLHELGHFKQYTNIGGIPPSLDADKSQLLEYNNVILNENLFDEAISPTENLAGKPSKYMKTLDGKYKRCRYNQAKVEEERGGIKVKNEIIGFEKILADQIIQGLVDYENDIKDQIKGQLLADCKNYFEKA